MTKPTPGARYTIKSTRDGTRTGRKRQTQRNFYIFFVVILALQAPAATADKAAAVPALAGVQLMRVPNSSFGGSETVYSFCANGRYRYAYQSLAGGSPRRHSANSGVWRQDGERVQLQSSKGASELPLRRISPLRVQVNGLAHLLGRSGC